MADGCDTTLAGPNPEHLVDGLKTFVGDHDGASAVIEYVGRRGARINLVGGDGVWADEFAPDTDVARSACVEAGIEVENTWERELLSQMRSTNDLWRSMERRPPIGRDRRAVRVTG